jgi:hypothetical protein
MSVPASAVVHRVHKKGVVVRVEGAVVKEQGQTFAIVVVKPSLLNDPTSRDEAILTFSQQLFQGLPVVLMAQDGSGVPTYYGRPEISQFLAEVPLESIPWQQYTFS